MGVNHAVINALEAALVADPSDRALRLRLVELYLEGGQPGDADRHATIALGVAPDDRDALMMAQRTALAVGDNDRADRYRRLLDVPPTPGQPPKPNSGEVSGGPTDEVDWELHRLVADERRAAPITLADVGGMAEVKHQLELSLLGPLRNPEVRAAFAVNLRGGLLLWGPPGCGKTFVARAVAGELGANFIPVALRQVIDPLIGMTERNLHTFFEQARRAAPAVMFFDELDAIGAKRSRLHNVAWLHNLVGALLDELDGMDRNQDLYILGTTNQPWEVDPALRRPGRFDRTVLVLPPDPAARRSILAHHLRDLPVAAEINLEPIVGGTDGHSGADLALTCRHAAELAMEDALANGQVRPIGQEHLRRAMSNTPASTGAWFDLARNYALYANQHGDLDQLVVYMRKKRLL